MKVLVTGGAGFIGSHLVEALVNEGAKVVVFDDFSTGKRENLTGIKTTIVEGDVANLNEVRRAVDGCELVFHQAALVSVPRSIKEPALNQKSNVTGTFNVFEAARLAGVKRVVYASSAAVYGNLPGLPKEEEGELSLLTPYAMSKRAGELIAESYWNAYQLKTVGLRYMNVFGPRQDPRSPYSGVLSIFCQAAINGTECTIFGDGEQTRDFVYVADVVQANLRAAKVKWHRFPTAVLNVGRGEATSLNQILAFLGELEGREIKRSYREEREGDIRHSWADISRAREWLGYEPKISLLEGLEKSLSFFRR